MGIIMLFLIMICSMQMCHSERGSLTVHIPVTSGKFQTRSGLLSYLQSTGHDYSHSYRIQTSITLKENRPGLLAYVYNTDQDCYQSKDQEYSHVCLGAIPSEYDLAGMKEVFNR